MKKELTIVILSYNDRESIIRSLESLQGVNARIIVVDNASTDGTRHAILEQFPGVRIIKHSKNIGVSRARNAGVRAVRTPYVLLLDSDTIITPEAVGQLLEHMHAHRGAGIAAPALVDEDGRISASHLPYPGLFYELTRWLRSSERINFSKRSCWVLGAAMIMSRRTYARVGPFDEKIFYGPDDADYCLRVRKTGKRIDYLPGVTAIHLGGWKRRSLFSRLGRKHFSAMRHFWLKHRRWLF